MIREDYDALNKMLEEFRKEICEIDIQIQNNFRQIKEADIYLKSLMGSESDDFKVFSPRKAEVLYKEEIRKIHEKVSELEKQNQDLSQKSDILNGYVDKLEDILNRNRLDKTAQWKSAENLKEASIQRLDDLLHRMEQRAACIDRNPIQAKQDFVIIGRCIREIVDEMRDTVWMTKEIE